jgi:hypothetical protein
MVYPSKHARVRAEILNFHCGRSFSDNVLIRRDAKEQSRIGTWSVRLLSIYLCDESFVFSVESSDPNSTAPSVTPLRESPLGHL